jgi:hypothetical protein
LSEDVNGAVDFARADSICDDGVELCALDVDDDEGDSVDQYQV